MGVPVPCHVPGGRGGQGLGREASALHRLPLKELQKPCFLIFCLGSSSTHLFSNQVFLKGFRVHAVSFYCRTNFPKTEWLKKVIVVVGQESGVPCAGCFWLSLSRVRGRISRLSGVRVGATSDLAGGVAGPATRSSPGGRVEASAPARAHGPWVT